MTAIEAGGGKFKSKKEGVAEGTVVKGKCFFIRSVLQGVGVGSCRTLNHLTWNFANSNRYHDLSMGGTEITRDEAEDRGVDITARYCHARLLCENMHAACTHPARCPWTGSFSSIAQLTTGRVNVNFVYIFSTKESDLPKPKAEEASPSQGRRHSEASLPITESNPLVDPLLEKTEEGPVFLTGPSQRPIAKRAESAGL